MEVYKIRRKADGLFSTGGSRPSFSTNGKIWKQKGHLTSHFNLVAQERPYLRDNKLTYDDCELVTFELTETEIDSITVSQYVKERKELQQERERAQERAWEKRQKTVRRKKFEELKKEFDID